MRSGPLGAKRDREYHVLVRAGSMPRHAVEKEPGDVVESN